MNEKARAGGEQFMQMPAIKHNITADIKKKGQILFFSSETEFSSSSFFLLAYTVCRISLPLRHTAKAAGLYGCVRTHEYVRTFHFVLVLYVSPPVS